MLKKAILSFLNIILIVIDTFSMDQNNYVTNSASADDSDADILFLLCHIIGEFCSIIMYTVVDRPFPNLDVPLRYIRTCLTTI